MEIKGTQMNKLYANGWGGKYIIDIDHMKIFIKLDCDDENECEDVYNKFLTEDFLKHDKEALEHALYERFGNYFDITDFDKAIRGENPYCFLNGGCYVSFDLYHLDYDYIQEDLC